MYEERGPGRQVSLATKSWLLTMQLFFRLTRPQLYSFQGTLPSLPVPSLEDTRRKANTTTYNTIITMLLKNHFIAYCSIF